MFKIRLCFCGNNESHNSEVIIFAAVKLFCMMIFFRQSITAPSISLAFTERVGQLLKPVFCAFNFDFKAAKSVNAAQIKALAENTSWVKQTENIIIFGPSGVGKSHLAAAIGLNLIMQNMRVLFTQTTTNYLEIVHKP